MKAASFIVLVVLAALVGYEAVQVVPLAVSHIKLYRWVAVGMVAAFVVMYFGKHNIDFLKVFTHELSHALVGVCMGRKILEFNVKRYEGVVLSKGGGYLTSVFTSLAPYCLPYFTYTMLFIWSLVASKSMVASGELYGIDIIIGLTLGLHLTCFWTQTGRHQTDITKFNAVFAYLFIWTFRILNLMIILLTFLPTRPGGGPNKLWGAFIYTLQSFSYANRDFVHLIF